MDMFRSSEVSRCAQACKRGDAARRAHGGADAADVGHCGRGHARRLCLRLVLEVRAWPAHENTLGAGVRVVVVVVKVVGYVMTWILARCGGLPGACSGVGRPLPGCVRACRNWMAPTYPAFPPFPPWPPLPGHPEQACSTTPAAQTAPCTSCRAAALWFVPSGTSAPASCCTSRTLTPHKRWRTGRRTLPASTSAAAASVAVTVPPPFPLSLPSPPCRLGWRCDRVRCAPRRRQRSSAFLPPSACDTFPACLWVSICAEQLDKQESLVMHTYMPMEKHWYGDQYISVYKQRGVSLLISTCEFINTTKCLLASIWELKSTRSLV